MKTDSISNQLRWVILLLAAAVILPTVCLLWFMAQAVKNERLAIRQKLMDICNKEVEDLERKLIQTVKTQNEDYSHTLHLAEKTDMLLWVNSMKQDADSIVIYGNDGNLIYPIKDFEAPVSFFGHLQTAFELEQKSQFQEALEIYRQATEPNQPAGNLFGACMGQIRCLDKLERITDAMDLFHKLLWSENKKWRNQFTANQVAMLRVKQVELLAKHRDTYASGNMFADLKAWYTPWETYPSETTIWALNKILDITPEFRDTYKLNDSIESAQNTIQTETIALTCADFFNTEHEYQKQPAEQWFAIPSQPEFFIMAVSAKNYDVFFIKKTGDFLSAFEQQLNKFPMTGTKLKLYDNLNRVIFGAAIPPDEPFIVSDFGDFSAGWKLELYFDTDNPFQTAAKRQASIYTWTGFLAAVLILLAGSIAIRAVSNQIKMNRLKNDFIATVTHELKTPLASMRVLVDTLLEKRYDNEATATEYLQMVANENKRLTHLIDSFLTFSRMERNKQVFDFQSVLPDEITAVAVEALQTKLSGSDCQFFYTVDENLPLVHADKDAMATVLVNLLDNAYKYTNSDKSIELRVYEQDGFICFSVSDNGIGMSPRAVKKIFNRFYQVDSRLSRQAEGCGLGLSIVKFIVDAHKGKVEIVSQPGQGSTFTVKLPGCKE